MGERLQKFRSQRLDLLNKDREYQAFEIGQIMYIIKQGAVLLKLVVGKSDVITLAFGHIQGSRPKPIPTNVFRWINLPPFN